MAYGMAGIRRDRGVPANRGMRVTFDGKPGRIVSAYGGYLMVRLDGSKWRATCHPWWHMVYHTSKGDVRVNYE